MLRLSARPHGNSIQSKISNPDVGPRRRKRSSTQCTMSFRWKLFKHVRRSHEVIKCVSRIRNWHQIIVRFAGLRRDAYPVELRTRAGLRVSLNSFVDVLTAWTIFCKDEYEVDAESVLIIDIGANIGLFALLAASKARRATIIAVEPYPPTFAVLSENIKRNGFETRVVCDRLAVDGDNTVGIMPLSSDDWTISRKLESARGSTSSPGHKVEVVTLKSLLARHETLLECRRIDLLKLDSEGSELNTILKADHQLLNRFQMIQLEYHSPEIRRRVMEHLLSAGFQLERASAVSAYQGMLHFRGSDG